MKEKKSKKIKKGTNAGIQVLLCILAGGYFLFFTSKIWMPNNETLIEPTSLYARQVMDRHEVYLSQWAYSVKDRAMEVIIEIEAKDLVSENEYYMDVFYLFNFISEKERPELLEYMEEKAEITYFTVYAPDQFEYIHNPEFDRLIPVENKNPELPKKKGFFRRKQKQGVV